MSSIHDTLNALRAATEAFDRIPELEARIRKLEEDLAFAQLEAAEYQTTITQQRERIKMLELDNEYLNGSLSAERDRNASLETKVYELTIVDDAAQAKINDLSIDIDARDTMISLLEADKAALHARLSDFTSMADRLKASLVRSAPAALEVAAQTFPLDQDRNLDNPAPTSANVEMDLEPVTIAADYNPFNRF